MCCGDKQQSSTTTSTSYPKWLTEAFDTTWNAAKDITELETPTTADRADWNSFQTGTGDLITANNPNGNLDAASGVYDRVAEAGPSTIDYTGRVVDEDGALGSVSSYMDPYLAEALAPALREISRGAQQQRLAAGDSAMAAGAYGSTRHGVAEGMIGRNELEALGDTTVGAYSNAFNTAMGLRANDLSRLDQVNTFNANQMDENLARVLSAGQGMHSIGVDRFNMGRTHAADVMGYGDAKQLEEQSGKDWAYNKAQGGRNRDIENLNILSSVLRGAPAGTTTTTTQTAPDNSWAQLLAAGAGAFF
jgi:hypothetical protein